MLTVAALGCGDDQTNKDGETGSPEAGAACLDLAGTWTIASHCDAALVGTAVPVTQRLCVITTGGMFAGLSGPVAQSGTFALRGTISGTTVSCMGTASDKQLSETCTGDCAVTLTR
ncbi:MAG: hypothetical protein JWN48_4818 [Myxococcaceae bacterium]|nr:hypothetical protein [Myxococcaceae bacterium]